MCGICGMIKKNSVDNTDKKLVQEMCDKLVHRGPDDSGYFQDTNVALAHRRLSILDLSSAGHQPMEYEGRYEIVFNGEIYNYIEIRDRLKEQGYSFRTKTDTEVIMAAYDAFGTDCFKMMNGMWALALWDKQSKKLLLSRDRFGVKPLYYYKDEKKIIFSSEIKSLICDRSIRRRANDNIVYDYLTQGLIEHTNETFYEGIYKIPEGTFAIVSENLEINPISYYNISFAEVTGDGATQEDIENFRSLFDKSVRLRLRSDVPVGSCLSGGLDSSAIVCEIDSVLHEQESKEKQFTFSYRSEDKKIDEYRYMNAVIEATNVDAKFVTPKASNLINDLDSLIYYQDEPFSTTGMYAGYCVYRKARENNVKVLLDGQGADEILCGYRKSRIYYLGMLKREKRYLKLFIELIASMSQLGSTLRIRSMIKSDINKVRRILHKEHKYSNIPLEFFNEDFIEKTKGYDYNRRDNFQYNDVKKVSLPGLLRYTDRNSMAFSVESRLPFLDYEFVDFCAQLPMSAKLEKGYSKAIMRKALRLPEVIRKRKDKIGFATPEDQWIKDEEMYIKKIMGKKDFKAKRFLNQNKIMENWYGIINNNEIPYFFRLVCLERWMEIFEVE